MELDGSGRVVYAAKPLWPAGLAAIASKAPAQWPDIAGDPALAAHLAIHRDDYTVMRNAAIPDAPLEAAPAKPRVIEP